MIKKRKVLQRKCNFCNKEYFARVDKLKEGIGLHCSRKCSRAQGGRSCAKKYYRNAKNFELAASARRQYVKALRNGKILKHMECKICKSKKKIVGHHEDYSKAFETVGLCQPCHLNWHMGRV